MKMRGDSSNAPNGPQGTEPFSGETQANWEATLEPWIPRGIAGHIGLVTSSYLNTTLVNQLPSDIGTNTNYNSPFEYDPTAAFTSTPTHGLRGNETLFRIAEIGYRQESRSGPGKVNSTGPYRLYAKSPGRGTKFWMLKLHELDPPGLKGENDGCISGLGVTFSSRLEPSDGMEYPVTLRVPFIGTKYPGVYAYCATYDPNPQGSTMSLIIAPCGHTTCVPGPPEASSASASPTRTLPHWSLTYVHNTNPSYHSDIDSSYQPVQTVSRNPDGTVAPAVFNTRSYDCLDPSRHVAQVFLYDPTTGDLRPVYNPEGMGGRGEIRIHPQREIDPPPTSLWRSVVMRFEVGNRRPPQGAQPDYLTIVQHPAVDRKTRRHLKFLGLFKRPTVKETEEGPEADDSAPEGSYSLPWQPARTEIASNLATGQPPR